MLLLGIDVGTTGAKAAIFDALGNQIGYGFAEYGINCPKPGWAEQDAEEVWRITKGVIAEAAKEYGHEVDALSVSVQGDAVVPIDANRCAIAPVQLGMDYRGTAEADECAKLFGERHLFDVTGMRPHPLNSLIKILWIKNNDPALYERACKFVTYADFILGKLGSDEIVIDYTMSSRTMAFDIVNRNWSPGILSGLDIAADKLAEATPSGTIVGKLPAGLASELGLRPGAKIVSGGHDQTCAALGAGVIREDLALDSHGTAEVLSMAFSFPRLDDTMFNGFYPCYLHAVPDTYFTFALNHTGGILLKWFVDEFCYKDQLEAAKTTERLYEFVLERSADDLSPVMVLPYFNGSGTPNCDLKMKGGIWGLTLATTRYDIARAIVEALSFELRLNIESLRMAGVNISELRCAGGGARSPIGLQNKADITGLPVSALKVREAACLGAAMLAGLANGAYKNHDEAASVVRISDRYEPRKEKYDLYNERYCLYEKAYDIMKPLFYSL